MEIADIARRIKMEVFPDRVIVGNKICIQKIGISRLSCVDDCVFGIDYAVPKRVIIYGYLVTVMGSKVNFFVMGKMSFAKFRDMLKKHTGVEITDEEAYLTLRDSDIFKNLSVLPQRYHTDTGFYSDSICNYFHEMFEMRRLSKRKDGNFPALNSSSSQIAEPMFKGGVGNITYYSSSSIGKDAGSKLVVLNRVPSISADVCLAISQVPVIGGICSKDYLSCHNCKATCSSQGCSISDRGRMQTWVQEVNKIKSMQFFIMLSAGISGLVSQFLYYTYAKSYVNIFLEVKDISSYAYRNASFIVASMFGNPKDISKPVNTLCNRGVMPSFIDTMLVGSKFSSIFNFMLQQNIEGGINRGLRFSPIFIWSKAKGRSIDACTIAGKKYARSEYYEARSTLLPLDMNVEDSYLSNSDFVQKVFSSNYGGIADTVAYFLMNNAETAYNVYSSYVTALTGYCSTASHRKFCSEATIREASLLCTCASVLKSSLGVNIPDNFDSYVAKWISRI